MTDVTQLKAALNSLVDRTTVGSSPGKKNNRLRKRAKQTVVRYNPGGGQSGDGLVPPLVEPDASTRVFWTEEAYTSSDGLFTWVSQTKHLKEMTLVDSAATDVVIQLDDPENPAGGQ